MKVFPLSVALGLALIVTTPSFAQEGGRDQRRSGDQQQDGRGARRDRERRQDRVNPLMAALDLDKNGILSAEEIAGAATALKTLDRNKDGAIQADELRPPRNQPTRQNGAPEQAAERPAAGPNPFVDRVMARDADKDGKVSKEEAGERMANFFGSMDSDNDGYLTKKELEEMSKRFQRGGGRTGGSGGRSGGGQQPKSKDNRPPYDDD